MDILHYRDPLSSSEEKLGLSSGPVAMSMRIGSVWWAMCVSARNVIIFRDDKKSTKKNINNVPCNGFLFYCSGLLILQLFCTLHHRFGDMQEIINFPTFASPLAWVAGVFRCSLGWCWCLSLYLPLVSPFDLWTSESVD